MLEVLGLITITIFVSLYGVLSRMCGGGYLDLPYGLDQWIYALPYGILGALCGILLGGWPFVVGFFIVSFAFAFLGKRTGHGSYMDLATWTKGNEEPERLDFIVRLFFGRDKFTADNQYQRDLFGLCVTGAFVTLGAVGCLIYTGHYILAPLVFLGGAAKGLAYIIGWSINPGHVPNSQSELDEATEVGELLTGVFGGIPLMFSILYLIHLLVQ